MYSPENSVKRQRHRGTLQVFLNKKAEQSTRNIGGVTRWKPIQGCPSLVISFLYHMLISRAVSGFFTTESQPTAHTGISAQTARREFWDKGKK